MKELKTYQQGNVGREAPYITLLARFEFVNVFSLCGMKLTMGCYAYTRGMVVCWCLQWSYGRAYATTHDHDDIFRMYIVSTKFDIVKC